MNPNTSVPRASRVDPDVEPVSRLAKLSEQGPNPHVLGWLRAWCVFVNFGCLLFVILKRGLFYRLQDIFEDQWEWSDVITIAVFAVLFGTSIIPLFWRRRRYGQWVYGFVYLVFASLVLVPIPILVYWLKARTRIAFENRIVAGQHIRIVNAEPDAETDPSIPPFALHYLRLLALGTAFLMFLATVLLGVLIGSQTSVSVWWLALPMLGFLLAMVPLRMREPLPWHWWYGLGFILVAVGSAVLTVVALPLLWLWCLPANRRLFDRPATFVGL